MRIDDSTNFMEDIRLKHDNGNDIVFNGRLFAESSWFDEDSSTLTRQKLYVAENNEQVYYIVRSNGPERSRNAYRLKVTGNYCTIFDGMSEITLEFDMLMLAVRQLCGLDANSTPTLYMVEELLKAANA